MNPADFIIPLIGILLIVLLVWLSGGRRTVRLTRETVRAALAAEGHETSTVTVADDGCTALAWLESRNALAILRSMGDHPAILIPGPDDIRGISIKGDPPRLQVQFRSFAQPPFAIVLDDQESLDRWRKVLMLYGELAVRKEASA